MLWRCKGLLGGRGGGLFVAKCKGLLGEARSGTGHYAIRNGQEGKGGGTASLRRFENARGCWGGGRSNPERGAQCGTGRRVRGGGGGAAFLRHFGNERVCWGARSGTGFAIQNG